jgi:hypothetical protein
VTDHKKQPPTPSQLNPEPNSHPEMKEAPLVATAAPSEQSADSPPEGCSLSSPNLPLTPPPVKGKKPKPRCVLRQIVVGIAFLLVGAPCVNGDYATAAVNLRTLHEVVKRKDDDESPPAAPA